MQIIFLLTLLFTLSPRNASAEKISVLATTGMIADVVKNIGLDEVDVSTLMGPGVDPHTYKPTAGDVSKLSKASIVFYNGLLLEGKLSEVLNSYGKKKPVIPVAEVIMKDKLIQTTDFGNHPDPHVWMDVRLWAEVATAIEASLSQFRPTKREYFSKNNSRLQLQFAQLDSAVRATIATIPTNARILVTAHDAFGYFGRAYAIEVKAIQGISTESEAGLHDINKLIDFLVKRKIPAVFVESSVSEKNIRALVEGALTRNHSISIGGELYSDAMGVSGSLGETYPGMILHNTETIVKALGGQSHLIAELYNQNAN